MNNLYSTGEKKAKRFLRMMRLHAYDARTALVFYCTNNVIDGI